MFYFNGQNDLEDSAACALLQLLSLPQGRDVNLAIELAFTATPDVPSQTLTTKQIECEDMKGTIPYWRGVRRFAITAGTSPLQSARDQFLGVRLDMRKGHTLADFVRWATRNYRAQHYILIMKDHGVGKPYLMLAENMFPQISDGTLSPPASMTHLFSSEARSNNKTTEPLLNLEIQAALHRVLHGSRFEIIGFDSCFKAMIETAYAMRTVARTLIASEAIQYDYAWDYAAWLSVLIQHPDLDRLSLSRIIVATFAARDIRHPRDDLQVTLSSTDLEALGAITSPLNTLARAITEHDVILKKMSDLRAACPAPETFDVDIVCFAGEIEKLAAMASAEQEHLNLKFLAEKIQKAIKNIVEPYQNKSAVRTYRANGLAIYFPECRGSLSADAMQKRYDPGNPIAIEFAKNNYWSVFIQQYLPNTSATLPCRGIQ